MSGRCNWETLLLVWLTISGVASLYEIDEERAGSELDSENERTERPANTDDEEDDLETAIESSSADEVNSLLICSVLFRMRLFVSFGMKIWLADLLLIDSDTDMWHELDELDEYDSSEVGLSENEPDLTKGRSAATAADRSRSSTPKKPSLMPPPPKPPQLPVFLFSVDGICSWFELFIIFFFSFKLESNQKYIKLEYFLVFYIYFLEIKTI